MSCFVLSCPFLPCPALSCPILSCLVCPGLSCFVLPYHVLSCIASPCLLFSIASCHVLYCVVLSCLESKVQSKVNLKSSQLKPCKQLSQPPQDNPRHPLLFTQCISVFQFNSRISTNVFQVLSINVFQVLSTNVYTSFSAQGGITQCRGRGRGKPLPREGRKGVGRVEHSKPPSRGWWD